MIYTITDATAIKPDTIRCTVYTVFGNYEITIRIEDKSKEDIILEITNQIKALNKEAVIARNLVNTIWNN